MRISEYKKICKFLKILKSINKKGFFKKSKVLINIRIFVPQKGVGFTISATFENDRTTTSPFRGTYCRCPSSQLPVSVSRRA